MKNLVLKMGHKSGVLDSEDFFDRLPDEILVSIFEKVPDAQNLIMFMAVCKRFRSLIPLVRGVSLRLPRKRRLCEALHRSRVRNPVVRALTKPMNFVSRVIKSKLRQSGDDDCSYAYYAPSLVLKPFDEMRSLHLRMPGHGRECKSSTLKWRAEFGSQFRSCVVFAANSITQKRGGEESVPEVGLHAPLINNRQLNQRIKWTISTLVAAAARHSIVQKIVGQQKMLEEVVVTDESNQGKLCMNKEQVEELRNLSESEWEDLSNRSNGVPHLRMKMWYFEKLELPESGRFMEGATVVAIRPEEEMKLRIRADKLVEGFDVEEEAVKKLILSKRCYVMDIKSY